MHLAMSHFCSNLSTHKLNKCSQNQETEKTWETYSIVFLTCSLLNSINSRLKPFAVKCISTKEQYGKIIEMYSIFITNLYIMGWVKNIKEL